MTPADVRNALINALQVDLVGPAQPDEVLDQAPSRWYLTGFLAPINASEDQRSDLIPSEEPDLLDEQGGADDNIIPEPASARRAHFPASLGLSVLVGAEVTRLEAQLDWGEYRLETSPPETTEPEGEESSPTGAAELWRRTPGQATLTVPLPPPGKPATGNLPVPDHPGLKVSYAVRPVPDADDVRLPPGARVVSVFLANERGDAASPERRDEHYLFQAQITVTSPRPLLPHPNLRGRDSDDWDERVADLHYRDAGEYAVGHGVATEALLTADGHCHQARTVWIPQAAVERIAPAAIPDVELGMEALAELPDAAAAERSLGPLVTHYRAWIARQRAALDSLPADQQTIAEALLVRAEAAAGRIAAGIAQLADPQVWLAFRLANKAMARAARRSRPREIPAWRPFQLAFILLNLRGLADPTHADRDVVDLLFFPTGGGKTEAYLGLAAFALILRRRRYPGVSSAGVAVLMRYTLRLLTLDQLSRAAALICALELERQADPETLGSWPFEIGLWVGSAATPNRMGRQGDVNPYTARKKTLDFKRNDRNPAPIPLEECPWCGTKFTRESFQLLPNPDTPLDLRIVCVNRDCDFAGRHNRPLPILSIDEPIYRRLPGFLIATVDKFAAMPWTGEVGAFFGRVDRWDKDGFYGPCDPHRGQPLAGGGLPPPDLIIQDELHLISGPLGTIAGLYEAALDALCARETEGAARRSKIIASTATVRHAEQQIRALFNRPAVDIFPPPGVNRRDAFFAETHTPAQSQPRLYVGLAAQGRSLKVVLLRAYLALLGAAQKAWSQAGGQTDNPADPYMTLVGYFNSLRELGGSRRIVEDEITNRLTGYGQRRRVNETDGLFADRSISFEVLELTSRVSTDKVAQAKRRLNLPFADPDRVDIALATNMISVGLDVPRLGLMAVLGQPKTSAEYIQATSRVGRDPRRSGLVVTLLNIHRPRDRSHYERFHAYHQSFYRSVEATSVTPFSPRALDRALAAVVVALARLSHGPLTAPLSAGQIAAARPVVEAFVMNVLGDRAAGHALFKEPAEADTLRAQVRQRALALLDAWAQIAQELADQGVPLKYQRFEEGAPQQLLYEFLSPELAQLSPRQRQFRANRSMRDVEPNVNLWLKTLDNQPVSAATP